MLAEVVVCGAGMAGVAAAHALAVRRGMRDVVLVDPRPPLTLTSDKGTQAYRNWWPGPDAAMVQLVDRSIDLLDELAAESNDTFRMTRRGYLWCTRGDGTALRARAEAVAALGAGLVRMDAPTEPRGADFFPDAARVARRFSFLHPAVTAALHARRAGWLDAVALGWHLLDRAQAAGARLVRDTVVGFDIEAGRMRAVRLASGERIEAPACVLAPGPLLRLAAAGLGFDVPVQCVLHAKLAFVDERGALPRDAPLVILDDPVRLAWSAVDRDALDRAGRADLLDELPAGVHARPVERDGRPWVFVLWSYREVPGPPVFPPPFDPWFARVALRGIAEVVPGFAAYDAPPQDACTDGGYYCETPDRRPLVGPLPVEGAFVLGGLAGFGIMASQAAAELLAAHVAGSALPAWAAALNPNRFADAAYRKRLASGAFDAGTL